MFIDKSLGELERVQVGIFWFGLKKIYMLWTMDMDKPREKLKRAQVDIFWFGLGKVTIFVFMDKIPGVLEQVQVEILVWFGKYIHAVDMDKLEEELEQVQAIRV
jgi:hypothetical protein